MESYVKEERKRKLREDIGDCVKVLLYCPRTIIGIGAIEAFAVACPLELAVRTFCIGFSPMRNSIGREGKVFR